MPIIIPIAFLAFIALGLPDGILGVAWPSMRADFKAPLDALGLLLAVTTAGYMVSSFSCGKLLAHMSIGLLLALSTWLTAVSLVGYAVLPVFSGMLITSVLAGLGGGAVDSALNTYAAFRFRPRTLNWLHACYSLGAFLGPATISVIFALGLGWRHAYALVAVGQTLLGLVFFVTRNRWEMTPGAPVDEVKASTAISFRDSLRHGPVWWGVLAFFLYVGMELSVSQWGYSLLIEGRDLSPARATLWVSVYWGAFTGGRVIMGFLPLGDRVKMLLRVCPVGMLAGAVCASLGGAGGLTLAGLFMLGLFFAPVYPALVAATPIRLGPRHSANAMGFQVAAGTLGIAVVPGLIGLAARHLGLESIGRGWAVMGVLVLCSLWAVARWKRPSMMSGNG